MTTKPAHLPFIIQTVKEIEDSSDFSQPNGQKRKHLSIAFVRDARLPIEDCIDNLRGIAEIHDWNPLGAGHISSASPCGVGLIAQYAVFKDRAKK